MKMQYSDGRRDEIHKPLACLFALNLVYDYCDGGQSSKIELDVSIKSGAKDYKEGADQKLK